VDFFSSAYKNLCAEMNLCAVCVQEAYMKINNLTYCT